MSASIGLVAFPNGNFLLSCVLELVRNTDWSTSYSSWFVRRNLTRDALGATLVIASAMFCVRLTHDMVVISFRSKLCFADEMSIMRRSSEVVVDLSLIHI